MYFGPQSPTTAAAFGRAVKLAGRPDWLRKASQLTESSWLVGWRQLASFYVLQH